MNIAINGYGRMGQEVERAAASRGHEIVARFSSATSPDAEALAAADVIIDFSTAEALDQIVSAAVDSGTNLVIGTTGWDDRRDEIRERTASISVVWASNFSPGANMLFALARHAAVLAKTFGGFEAGVEERHHSKKKDSPSGTAIRLAEAVTEASEGEFAPPIAASRVGAEYGLHTLFLDSEDDLVELSHRARSRRGFATGAVLASERLEGRHGFFTFPELLGLDQT
ncbi:MAG: 4-hydroxy-tetrahydrodipicolinate reductase [Acidobacteria bacterium]|nr:4-hydroxy-tetrahydrodipicolinate reductase [Acidobacteriota bacterium]